MYPMVLLYYVVIALLLNSYAMLIKSLKLHQAKPWTSVKKPHTQQPFLYHIL